MICLLDRARPYARCEGPQNFKKLNNDMNKNFLLTAPVGAALGTAIYSGYLDGFSHLDWYRVIAVALVTFAIEVPIVFFARRKNESYLTARSGLSGMVGPKNSKKLSESENEFFQEKCNVHLAYTLACCVGL